MFLCPKCDKENVFYERANAKNEHYIVKCYSCGSILELFDTVEEVKEYFKDYTVEDEEY